MLRRMLIAGLLAGGAAGLLATLLQQFGTTPLILEAETYELGAAAAEGLDLARLSGTLLANLVTGVGFGLLLAAGMGVSGTERPLQGLLWGLGGFLAFNLLPGLGLAPEPPGVEAGPLADRQLWWIATALASVLGLLVIAFAPRWWLRPLGLLPIALPHVIGAPHLAEGEAAVPADLIERFVVASLVTAGLFWIFLGTATALLFRRLQHRKA